MRGGCTCRAPCGRPTCRLLQRRESERTASLSAVAPSHAPRRRACDPHGQTAACFAGGVLDPAACAVAALHPDSWRCVCCAWQGHCREQVLAHHRWRSGRRSARRVLISGAAMFRTNLDGGVLCASNAMFVYVLSSFERGHSAPPPAPIPRLLSPSVSTVPFWSTRLQRSRRGGHSPQGHWSFVRTGLNWKIRRVCRERRCSGLFHSSFSRPAAHGKLVCKGAARGAVA